MASSASSPGSTYSDRLYHLHSHSHSDLRIHSQSDFVDYSPLLIEETSNDPLGPWRLSFSLTEAIQLENSETEIAEKLKSPYTAKLGSLEIMRLLGQAIAKKEEKAILIFEETFKMLSQKQICNIIFLALKENYINLAESAFNQLQGLDVDVSRLKELGEIVQEKDIEEDKKVKFLNIISTLICTLSKPINPLNTSDRSSSYAYSHAFSPKRRRSAHSSAGSGITIYCEHPSQASTPPLGRKFRSASISSLPSFDSLLSLFSENTASPKQKNHRITTSSSAILTRVIEPSSFKRRISAPHNDQLVRVNISCLRAFSPQQNVRALIISQPISPLSLSPANRLRFLEDLERKST